MLNVRLKKLLSLLTLVAVVLTSAIFLLACKDDEIKGGFPCEPHSFIRVEDAGNRVPTYDVEGRELRKCTECGVSAYFVIPKLERIDGRESEGYLPLLSSYVVSYGETLEEVKSKYFTSGWDFVLEGKTLVGNASEEGYDFKAVFTPTDNKYSVVETTVRLIVKKATLSEIDITLNDPLRIPTDINSLEEMPLTLSESQVIKGSVRWVENQEILRNQSSYYEYIFTPEDTDNYEIYVGRVLLNA